MYTRRLLQLLMAACFLLIVWMVMKNNAVPNLFTFDSKVAFVFENGSVISKEFIEDALKSKMKSLAQKEQYKKEANEQSSKGAQPLLSQEKLSPKSTAEDGSLTMFDEAAYKEAIKTFPIDVNRCKVVRELTPNYYVCAYDPRIDHWVSGAIMGGRAWERSIGVLAVKALQHYAGPNSTQSVMLDIGSNIGTHGLYAAASNFHVWAIDALTMNQVKVYHAASMSNTSSFMHQVHNILDNQRHVSTIVVQKGNIGGSTVRSDVKPPGSPGNVGNVAQGPIGMRMTDKESLKAVLLSDVIDAVVLDTQPRIGKKVINVVIKMDIEHYECRALLGSPNLFHDPRVFIPYVIMEWTYTERILPGGKRIYEKECPEDMLRAMTKQFVDGGYTPYKEGVGTKLDPASSLTWQNTNMVWVHKDAPVMY